MEEQGRNFGELWGAGNKQARVDWPSRVALPRPTPQEIRDALSAFESVGVDEMILEPGIGDLDQLERLADVVADF